MYHVPASSLIISRTVYSRAREKYSESALPLQHKTMMRYYVCQSFIALHCLYIYFYSIIKLSQCYIGGGGGGLKEGGGGGFDLGGGGMGILLRDFFFNGTGSKLFSPIDKGIASEYLTTFSTVVVFASLLSFVVGRSTFVVDCFFGILNSKVVVGSLRIL